MLAGSARAPAMGYSLSGAKIPDLLQISPETALHEATSSHLAPTPHPTPWGGSTAPKCMLGTPIYGLGPTNGLIGPRGWVAKMGVLQEISGEMGQIPYHGQYQGIPYHTISYQFTIVKRYFTGQWTKSYELTIVIR